MNKMSLEIDPDWFIVYQIYTSGQIKIALSILVVTDDMLFQNFAAFGLNQPESTPDKFISYTDTGRVFETNM